MQNISIKIYQEIKDKIQNKDLPANAKLQSTRKLAQIYRVSQPTILHVLDVLEKDGFVERFARSGVFVKGKEELKTISILKKPKIEEKADQIYQAIRESIVKSEGKPQTKLLSSRKLAEIYQVSRLTIFQVLKKLEKDGLIEKFTRSGSFIKGSRTDPLNSPAVFKKARAVEIAEDIISCISQGTFKIGDHLPLQKELMFRYKTSKKTIREVLNIISGKKLIFQKGSSFLVGGSVDMVRQTKNRIYLIGREPPNKRQFQNIYTRQFFEVFEKEVQKSGITSIHFLDYNKNFLKNISKDSTAGFLLNVGYLLYNSNEELQELILQILEDFKQTRFSLVIENYHEISYRLPSFHFKPIKNVYPMWRDNFKAARKIGVFLASLGHKNIAYFAYGDAPWNQWRFEELQNTMGQITGNCGSVFGFLTAEGFDRYRQKGEFFDKISKKTKRIFNTFFFSDLFGTHPFDTDPIEEAYMEFGRIMYKDHHKKIMFPLFEKALELKNVTAWVCSGPMVSTVALEFLEKMGITVPDKISLMGFGNDEHVMSHNITVLDDQQSLAGYLAAHCILGDLPIKKNKQGLVEYESNLIIRKSTKKI